MRSTPRKWASSLFRQINGLPIPSRSAKTKQKVEALRRAEKNLDDFWVAVDGVVYVKCGSLASPANYRVLAQPRIIRRTPEWVEPSPSATKSGQEAVLDPELTDPYRPLSTILVDDSVESRNPTMLLTLKTKMKISDTTNQVAALSADVSPVDESQHVPVSIDIDGCSLKVVRTLYLNQAVTSSPGAVS
jgi:hypothetical protein